MFLVRRRVDLLMWKCDNLWLNWKKMSRIVTVSHIFHKIQKFSFRQFPYEARVVQAKYQSPKMEISEMSIPIDSSFCPTSTNEKKSFHSFLRIFFNSYFHCTDAINCGRWWNIYQKQMMLISVFTVSWFCYPGLGLLMLSYAD